MIKPACVQAGRLLEGRAAGLSRAAALTLEEHIASCPECNHDAQLLTGLGVLSDEGAAPLSAAARERAIAKAFAEHSHARLTTLRPAPARWAERWPALAAAALVLLGLSAGLRLIGPRAAGDRLVSGQLAVDGAPLVQGARVGETARLQTERGARVKLAHADVELRAGTRAEWDASARVVRLRAGSLLAEVDHARKQSFAVETEQLRVLVLGTRFEVEPARVRVLRGRVRVFARDGHALATLKAGESFAWPTADAPAATGQHSGADAPAAAGQHSAADVQPSAADVQPATSPEGAPTAAPKSRETGAKAHQAVQAGPTRPRARATGAIEPQPEPPAPAHLLDEARRELAARRVDRARALLDAALKPAHGPRLSAAERAEALSLRADCALVEGHLAAAASGYLQVAERFARLPAGENALFAAGRLEAERGAHAAARKLLARYLEQYPHGRFVKEANARLRSLPSSDRVP